VRANVEPQIANPDNVEFNQTSSKRIRMVHS